MEPDSTSGCEPRVKKEEVMLRNPVIALFLALAAFPTLAQIWPPVPPLPPTYPGTVMPPGGGVCMERFIYDGGNLTGAVFITQSCAMGAGLGIPGPTGNFVPPAGTACTVVNGNLPVWVFPCVMVAANDIDGTPCLCKSTVYVVKDGSSYANHNVLSRAWGACVGAKDDAQTGAQWGFAVAGPTALFSQTASGGEVEFETYTVAVANGPAHRVATSMIYYASSGYSLIPVSVATQLGLVVQGSVDLAASDPAGLTLLRLNGLLRGSQSSFPWAHLPTLEYGPGVERSGAVLIVPDPDIAGLIVGGRGNELSAGLVHAAGGGPNGEDMIQFGVPVIPSTNPLRPFSVTPANAGPLGDIVIAPVVPEVPWQEGWTVVSFDTASGPFFSGPVAGLYPDAVTILLASTPAAVGNPWHFLPSAGAYPETAIHWPAGSLPPGVAFDVFTAYLTTSQELQVTSLTRVQVP